MSTSCDSIRPAAPKLHAGSGILVRQEKATAVEWAGLAVLALPTILLGLDVTLLYLALPALAAGAILIFILTLGFFITPAILGGGRVPMIANMMDLLINRLPRWELAAAISGVLLVITMVFFAAYQWLNSRQQA